MKQYDIAIIGAGTAGCFLADTLTRKGYRVALAEKSRGLGGRCSRRAIDQKLSVDLGAVSFRHQSGDLTEEIDRWQKLDYLQPWNYRISTFQAPQHSQPRSDLCGTPSMNRLHRRLSDRADLLTALRIERLESTHNGWNLLDEQGNLQVQASWVIVTVPAQQAQCLYPWSQEWQAIIEDAAKTTLNQWVCAVRTSQPNPQLADRYLGDHPVLAEVVRDSAKPSRDAQQEVWMLHSHFDWAASHLELDSASAGQQLMDSFKDALRPEGSLELLTSHRWLLARHTAPGLATRCLLDASTRIGLCGDWLANDERLDGIESALLSAKSLMHQLSDTPITRIAS